MGDAGAASVAASGRVEQSSDLGDGCGAGVDVAHRGAGGLVAGLGHDQLQRDLVVAEVGCCGVAQLVQVPSGVLLEQDAGAVVAESGPADVGADVASRGVTRWDGRTTGQEQRSVAAARAVGEAQESWEQVGGAGSPVDPFELAALGADWCAANNASDLRQLHS